MMHHRRAWLIRKSGPLYMTPSRGWSDHPADAHRFEEKETARSLSPDGDIELVEVEITMMCVKAEKIQ